MRRRARVEHEARAGQVAEQRAEVVDLGIDARADGVGSGPRNTISTIKRLRSYATRDRLSAQVRILDDRALTTVKFYNGLFGLPDELFRKVVRAL